MSIEDVMETRTILKTNKIGDVKYLAGFVELPMGVGLVLSNTIFGAESFCDESIAEIRNDFPEYDFIVSTAEFGMSDNLKGETQ